MKGEGREKGQVVEQIGPYSLLQPADPGLRITQDPLLLVDFALPFQKDERVLDIGTGSCVIPLALAAKSEVSDITAVEIDEESARLARENVARNSLDKRIRVVCADYRSLAKFFLQGHFSTIISNPPYIKANSGRLSPLGARAAARAEVHGKLEDLLQVSGFLLGKGGRLVLILALSRIDELMKLLKKNDFAPRRLRFVHPSKDTPAKLFMVEAVKGDGADMDVKTEEPVYLSGKV